MIAASGIWPRYRFPILDASGSDTLHLTTIRAVRLRSWDARSVASQPADCTHGMDGSIAPSPVKGI